MQGTSPRDIGEIAGRQERDAPDGAARDVPARRQAILALLVLLVVIERLPRDVGVARADGADALDGEQLALELDLVAGVAGERAGRSDDAVTRHHDRQRVPAERLRDGARRRRPADLGGDAGVRGDRAVRDGGGGAQHRPVEVAPRQAQVERPLEPRAIAPQVLEELAEERLDVGAVLLRLDAAHAAQPRGREIAPPAQVLHERHAVLRARDENVAERRGEDAVRHQARPEVGEPRLEPLAGAGHALGAGRGAAERAHHAVDLAVAMELSAARRARVDVALDAARGAGLGVTRRGGDEVDFDLHTALRLARHRGCSVVVGGSA